VVRHPLSRKRADAECAARMTPEQVRGDDHVACLEKQVAGPPWPFA